jgi:WD40 repeat protein
VAVAFSATDQPATADEQGDVRLWRQDGRLRFKFHAHRGWMMGIKFSPDNKILATGGWEDCTINLWNAETGQLLVHWPGSLRQTGWVTSLSFSPHGDQLLAGLGGGMAILFDAKTLHEITRFERHHNGVLQVAFSPDGSRVITGSWDAQLKLWDTLSGRECLALQGFPDSVLGLGFSADGSQLFGGDTYGTVHIWIGGSGPQ